MTTPSNIQLDVYRVEQAARLAAEGLNATEIGEKVERSADTIERWYRDEGFAARVQYHLENKLQFAENLMESAVPQALRVVTQALAGNLKKGAEGKLRYTAALFILERDEKRKKSGVKKEDKGFKGLTKEQLDELDE